MGVNKDPIKYINNKRYLNNISLKCRYDLIDLNRFCNDRLMEPCNTELFKIMSLIKLYEDGLINTNAKPKNKGFGDLLNKSLETKERINTSGIYQSLEKINHTEEHNMKQKV